MTIKHLIRIERLNYIVGGLYVLAAAIAAPRPWALGVLVGVALTCANFAVMRKLVQNWASKSPKSKMAAQMFLIPKMGILMGLIYLSAQFLPISVLGLATGFAIFLVSIAIETMRFTFNPNTAEDSHEAEGQHSDG